MGWPVRIERIENIVGVGTPDIHCICRGCVTWIELKVARWPVKETSRMKYLHPLDVDQENWHMRYAQQGGRSFILVGIERQRDLFLIPGSHHDEVNKMLRKDIVAYWIDWDGLLLTLEGKRNEDSRNESSIVGATENERKKILRPVS